MTDWKLKVLLRLFTKYHFRRIIATILNFWIKNYGNLVDNRFLAPRNASNQASIAKVCKGSDKTQKSVIDFGSPRNSAFYRLGSIFMEMNIAFTKNLASIIASDYQWLVGRKFNTPHGNLEIDMVESEPLADGTYQVYVVHDAFAKDSIPEFFGFQNPRTELMKYIVEHNIPFYPEKYS